PRGLAEENSQDALAAVEQFLADVGEVDLAEAPHMERVRKGLLQKALGYFQKFLQRRGSDPSRRYEVGRAHGRVADIHALLGEDAEAEQAYDRSIALLERLAAEQPAPAYRRELARNANNRGVLRKRLGELSAAEEAPRQALQLRRRLVAELADDLDCRQERAASHYHLGTLLAPRDGRRAEAAEAYRQALAMRQELAARFPERADYQ